MKPTEHAMKAGTWAYRLEEGTAALESALEQGDRFAIVAGLDDVSFWMGRLVGEAVGAGSALFDRPDLPERTQAALARAYAATQRAQVALDEHAPLRAPGYASWKWTQQDWRVVVPGRRAPDVSYDEKCGGESNRTPSGMVRLCLPLYVIERLRATEDGRTILYQQAKRKERAEPGTRVPWHPRIRELHAELDAGGEEDDPRRKRHGASGAGGHAAAELPHRRTRLRRIREAAQAGAHGRGWYTEAENEIALVARAWGVSPEYVAVAVAATSPATPVISSPRMARGGGKGSNIGKARATIKGIVARGIGGTPVHPNAPGMSRLRAFEDCLRTGTDAPDCVEVAFPDPEHVKTHAFVRNLLGIEDAVTVDRQVSKVVFGKVEDVTRSQYQTIVQDIRAVARELGWTPREVMAAVWTAAGGTGALRLATDRERARSRSRRV